MKSVLISIQPKWCELIASGKKTVEVRKSKPTLKTPFKCYIYCTKDEQYKIAPFRFADGWKIKRYDAKTNGNTTNMGYKLNGKVIGKVIGEFICDKVYPFFGRLNDHGSADLTPCKVLYGIGRGKEEVEFKQRCCLSHDELFDYAYSSKDHFAYGWHISDLKFYDKPKDVREFKKGCNDMDDPMYGSYCEYCEKKCFLTRPPQSYMYVEEIQE